mgnify:FL=1
MRFLCPVKKLMDLEAKVSALNIVIEKICEINVWIRRCTTAEEVLAITFTSVLPKDLQTHMDEILSNLHSVMASQKEEFLE